MPRPLHLQISQHRSRRLTVAYKPLFGTAAVRAHVAWQTAEYEAEHKNEMQATNVAHARDAVDKHLRERVDAHFAGNRTRSHLYSEDVQHEKAEVNQDTQ